MDLEERGTWWMCAPRTLMSGRRRACTAEPAPGESSAEQNRVVRSAGFVFVGEPERVAVRGLSFILDQCEMQKQRHCINEGEARTDGQSLECSCIWTRAGSRTKKVNQEWSSPKS